MSKVAKTKKSANSLTDFCLVKKLLDNNLLTMIYVLNQNFNPGNTAAEPNSSSIRSNWLYLAIRSEREAEPVLI